jgi:lipopolysaccharide export system permease protein
MIIARYLTREVFNALLAVTLVLLLALLSQQAVRYLNYVAIGKIPTNVLLQLVSYEVPYLLALLLPLGLYMGILLAYGRLYADHEMSILQLCGFGNQRIMRLTLFIACMTTGVVLFLMLWINPWVSVKQRQAMERNEATVHLVQTLIPGRFQASADGRHVMYVEKLSRDRERAQTVFLAQEKNDKTDPSQHPWMLVFADQGYQTKDKASQDQFFVTTDGYRYEGSPGQNDYKIIQFKKYAVRIKQPDAHTVHQEDETLSTTQLWDDYENPKRAAELQWRFSMGIATFLLALLAVPFSVVQPRKGRYMTLLPAILVYIVYMELLFMARHWVEQEMAPIGIGIWWVHGVMLAFVALMLLLTAKRLRQ